jgi:metal-responsive CopG/Arc/MetJ family transcriptional regulator
MPTRKRPKPERKPLLIFFPVEVIEAIDHQVRIEDTDRSKFIRKAVRNAMRSTRSA